MTALWLSAAVVVVAYFLGTVPTGLLLARARGLDIRSVGSHNIGATNVARNLGKRLGAVVLVLDALKGAVPAYAAIYLAAEGRVDAFAVTAAGFGAVCGHCFPVWLGFHGGKGVATSLGVMLVAAPLVTLIAAGIFAAVYAIFRIASIGSMTAAISFPPLLLAFGAADEVVTLALATALLILFTHRANIGRLIRHQENRV
jgi:glycerol-3-phosphate acyltransferase PlsY